MYHCEFVVFKILSFIMNMLTYSRLTQMQIYENNVQSTFKDYLIEAPAMNQLRLSPSPSRRERVENIIWSGVGNSSVKKEHIVIHFDICRGRGKLSD